MRMYDIIEKKRNSLENSREELQFLVDRYISGEVPDYQVSAWLMAVCCNGMSERETADLTEIMAYSGEINNLSAFGDRSVDKHSTGGVGDKTTLVVAPIVAALGGKVAKMSGRGLGFTGGTIDKLESIPNYKTTLSSKEFETTVANVGMAIIGQSGEIAPADKKFYALRDVTATVESIPLITSSVMSKKIASGSRSIVLDVKVGSGAFMKTAEQGIKLAENMVDIGKRLGKNMSAVITDMDKPLGNAVGNMLEVAEAVSVLKAQTKGDLYEVCVALATEMTALSLGISSLEAEKRVLEAIDNGSAFKKMCEWVSSQGGDDEYLKDTSLFRKAQFSKEVKSVAEGYITSMDTAKIGAASVILGAGRRTKNDAIDFSAGIIISKKTGDEVKKGDIMCVLYSNDSASLEEAEQRYLDAVKVGVEKPKTKPLIYKVIR